MKNSVPLESVRAEIEKNIRRQPGIPTTAELPLSADGKRVLSFAADAADRLDHKYIGTDHLLLGLLRVDNCLAARVLQSFALELASTREQIAKSPPEGGFRVRPSRISPHETVRDAVLIHSTKRDAETIRSRVAECRAFAWH